MRVVLRRWCTAPAIRMRSRSRQRLRGRHRRADPRRHAGLARRAAAPGHAPRWWSSATRRWPRSRRCSRSISATGRRPRRAQSVQRDSGGGAAGQAARVPDRPARRDPVQHRGRPAGAVGDQRSGTIDFDIANGVFGGDFTSRLNMNLREDKHWSYGARSSASSALGQRLWAAQRAGAERQDHRGDQGSAARDRRLRQRQGAGHRRGSRAHPGDHRAQPARFLRDRRARAVDHRRHQPLTAARTTTCSCARRGSRR